MQNTNILAMILRVSRQPPPIVYNDPPTTAFDVELELQSTTIVAADSANR